MLPLILLLLFPQLTVTNFSTTTSNSFLITLTETTKNEVNIGFKEINSSCAILKIWSKFSDLNKTLIEGAYP